ncbi:MAG: hypothetical protein GY928_16400 [Colwellia sp.]|nr:hypothetical protein [Colwellia sp.]
MVTLAYIDYEWSISDGTRKRFKEKTGLDLANTLWAFWLAYERSLNNSALVLMDEMTNVCDYFDAMDLFYCMFNDANSCVTIEEISDAMARTSNVPSDNPEKAHSWFIVMVQLAQQVSEYMSEMNKPKKKADSKES